MSDIGLTFGDLFPSSDVTVQNNDLILDDGLRTAILLSLYTDLGGWWSDSHPVTPGDSYGSRLHELSRSKRTQETLDKAIQFATEALQWLIDDKVAASLTVTAEFLTQTSGYAN